MTRNHGLQDVRGWAAMADERLDALIRQAVWSSFGNVSPSPSEWTRIRQSILHWQRRVREGETPDDAKPVREGIGRYGMFGWSDVLVQLERNKELQQRAEKYRLAEQALAGHQKRHRLYCRAMNWLGRRLVAWGWHLQERFGVASAIPTLQTANYTR